MSKDYESLILDRRASEAEINTAKAQFLQAAAKFSGNATDSNYRAMTDAALLLQERIKTRNAIMAQISEYISQIPLE